MHVLLGVVSHFCLWLMEGLPLLWSHLQSRGSHLYLEDEALVFGECTMWHPISNSWELLKEFHFDSSLESHPAPATGGPIGEEEEGNGCLRNWVRNSVKMWSPVEGWCQVDSAETENEGEPSKELSSAEGVNWGVLEVHRNEDVLRDGIIWHKLSECLLWPASVLHVVQVLTDSFPSPDTSRKHIASLLPFSRVRKLTSGELKSCTGRLCVWWWKIFQHTLQCDIRRHGSVPPSCSPQSWWLLLLS